MQTTIVEIGHEHGIVIPSEILERLNWQVGHEVQISEKNGKIFVGDAYPLANTNDVEGTEAFSRQLAAAYEAMEKYKVALKKLAE